MKVCMKRGIFKYYLVWGFLLSSLTSCNHSNVVALNKDSKLQKSKIFVSEVNTLEKKYKGKFGIYVTNNTRTISLGSNANQPMPFCSSFKFLLVAAVLYKSQHQLNLLNNKILFTPSDIKNSGYSPITSKHLEDGMTIEDLCRAAIEYSDNAAANALIKIVGGTDGLNTFMHKILIDKSFRIDRTEPYLNTALPGDLRDTISAKAMTLDVDNLLFGGVLSKANKLRLMGWLKGNTTGNNRIRAGVPKSWVVGDKTGTGDYGTTNDVAVLWVKGCSPIIMTVYFTQYSQSASPQDLAIADVARVISSILTIQDKCYK